MLEGGTSTSAFTMEWALLELILHPKIMKRAQEELDRVVGKNKQVLKQIFLIYLICKPLSKKIFIYTL
jgi:cytochrome P450